MNREEAPGKSPEDMYIQQKVRVLLMLKKMGSNVSRHEVLAQTFDVSDLGLHLVFVHVIFFYPCCPAHAHYGGCFN